MGLMLKMGIRHGFCVSFFLKYLFFVILVFEKEKEELICLIY
jgi:hypothetical protein